MNRLVKKISDFGLIFRMQSKDPQEVLKAARALKKAHNPVSLFTVYSRGDLEIIKACNEQVDLFIGADLQTPDLSIEEVYSSGAHFIFSRHDRNETSMDLFPYVENLKMLEKVQSQISPAIVIDRDFSQRNDMELQTPFLVEMNDFRSDIEKWRNHKFFTGAVLDLNPANKTEPELVQEISQNIQTLMGITFETLYLKKDSPKLSEGKTLAALTAMPLNEDSERDLLIIGVKDLDRFISYLKWQNIFMDPLSAKMAEETVLSTELYTEYLGWTVKLLKK